MLDGMVPDGSSAKIVHRENPVKNASRHTLLVSHLIIYQDHTLGQYTPLLNCIKGSQE